FCVAGRARARRSFPTRRSSDLSVPDRAFEQQWSDVRDAIRMNLSGGGKVVIHCRGGLGRTGLVAARLLVEEGCDAREAIERIRRSEEHTSELQSRENLVCRPPL